MRQKTHAKNDIRLFLCLLLTAGILFSVFALWPRRAAAGLEIWQNGSLVGTYPLSEDRVICLKDPEGGYNRIEIRDSTVSMEEADCPDLICVRHAPIERTGETIVCLPHKLILRIVGTAEDACTDLDASA